MSDEHIPASLRRQVADRARHCCEYCGAQARYSADTLTIDHIVPRGRGGKSIEANLALACCGCNQHKGIQTSASDPISELASPLFHPREQEWEAHFAWSDDFTIIVGLTPTGRATVIALQLNRIGVVNLRRVLYAIGEHPARQTGTA
ncbi:MAG TPA: HNH endonuclease signature motif containing protein [Blastocatellia bacterium]|nr:HNH endonuclease signature motif containing protein [Blastocatellia bacterium]